MSGAFVPSDRLTPTSQSTRRTGLALTVHQGIEVGFAIAVAHDNLGIDDRGSHRQAPQVIAYHGEAGRVVVTIPGEDHHIIASLVELRTSAVELDLMNPSATARWGGLQHGNGRFDKAGVLRHAADVGAVAKTEKGVPVTNPRKVL